jgi:catechol 2,3-dioxygenase-like lactoylglutathione lyase family enzyme
LQYYQVGIVVDDIEEAMAELGAALHLQWDGPNEREAGEWRFRMTYSLGGPPFVELIERTDGTPWDRSGIHHIGFWAEDLEAEKNRLAQAGLPIEVDGTLVGRPFTYHVGQSSGLRVELVDAAGRERLYGPG